MQNTTQKFRESSIVFRKPGILSKSLKPFTSSNYFTVEWFLLKLRSRFLLTNIYKRVCGIFLNFIQILSFLQKFGFLQRLGFYKLIFCALLTHVNDSTSKQNKKNATYPFVGITKQKTCVKFQPKILNSMVVGARQSFQFFRQRKLVSWKKQRST